MKNTNTYTFKTNANKYANLHTCDQKYWKFSCDFSTPQDLPTLLAATKDTLELLHDIVKAKAFKPENIADAKALTKAFSEQVQPKLAEPFDSVTATFLVYQLQRFAFRIWYRDTKAARDATRPTPAKAEPKAKAEAKAEAKAKTTKAKADAPAKSEPKAKAKTTKAKADTSKANEATLLGKMTKAQKKELVLALMAELLK